MLQTDVRAPILRKASGFFVAFVFALTGSMAIAQDTLFWDANGGTGGTGGTGSWNTSSSLWRLNSDVGPLQTWDNAGNVNGIFNANLSGTAGTVTLTEPITLRNLSIGTNNYVVAGTATNRLNFSGANVSITVPVGSVNATVSSPLTTDAASVLSLTGPTGNAALTLSGSNTIGGSLQITGTGKVTIGNAAALGSITSLSAAAGSSLTLSGNVTVSGVTATLSGGRTGNTAGGSSLQSQAGGAQWAGDLILGGNASIGARSGTLTVSGSISETGGSRSLFINPNTDVYGGDVVVLSGNNTYTGATTVNGSFAPTVGGLRISSNANLGSVTTGANVNLSNGVLYSTATFALDNAGANKRNVGLTGNATFNTAPATTLTISGNISGNSTASLIKANTGTLRLTGSNTYGGATTINAGTLDVAEGSINGTSGVTVGSNSSFIYDSATSLTKPVTLATDSRIGGDGTLGVNLVLASGVDFVFDPLKTLTVTGTVSVDDTFGVASLVNIDGSAIDWGSIADGTYTLIANGSDFSNISNFGLGNAADIGGGRSAFFQNGSLQLVVVPEPATWLLGLVALAGLARIRMVSSRSRR
jgi:fibronectin-binding autotransporter adhesin